MTIYGDIYMGQHFKGNDLLPVLRLSIVFIIYGAI